MKFQAEKGLVPGCDGAGIVKAVGDGVKSVKPGNKVVTYLLARIPDDARIDFSMIATALGMSSNGTLMQYGVYPHTNLVHAPSTVGFAAAATLPCSGLTAYNALYGLSGRKVRLDDWVLVQGTEGVSVAGLQIAVASGAHVIATTSSPEKAAKLRQLGA